ncbi:hypothetical protein B0H12DRAFT_1121489, partial [Mycena haematopus]
MTVTGTRGLVMSSMTTPEKLWSESALGRREMVEAVILLLCGACLPAPKLCNTENPTQQNLGYVGFDQFRKTKGKGPVI